MTADLYNLKAKAIGIRFPKALDGFERLQLKLPPARVPSTQLHAQSIVPISGGAISSTPSFDQREVPMPQAIRVPNGPATWTNVPLSSQSEPYHPRRVIIDRQRKPAVMKEVPNQSVEPRFGQAPYDVSPSLLNRLRRSLRSRDKNPKISGFRHSDGLYRCPWCRRQYARAVNFADHLVFEHERLLGPRKLNNVSQVSLVEDESGAFVEERTTNSPG